MARPLARPVLTRTVLTRYGVAWLYLAALVAAEVSYAALPADQRGALLRWASTDVVNLRGDPVGCLVASAFFPAGSLVAWPALAVWPALAALAMFGANRALGNWRTLLVCAAGQVIGTLVSEGIVGYRVAHGLLPGADRHIIDVGPSYVIVSAIVVAVLYGPALARAAAAADLALLVFGGHIFSGLTRLDVAPVGHATACAVAVVLGGLLAWRRRRARPRSGGRGLRRADADGPDAPPALPATVAQAEEQRAEPRGGLLLSSMPPKAAFP
jgi:hypothetical protein